MFSCMPIQANIFGVKFLPASGDRRLVSGAMDHTVQLHTLERLPTAAGPGPGAAAAAAAALAGPPGVVRGGQQQRQRAVAAATTVFSCHRGRVKVRSYDRAAV